MCLECLYKLELFAVSVEADFSEIFFRKRRIVVVFLCALNFQKKKGRNTRARILLVSSPRNSPSEPLAHHTHAGTQLSSRARVNNNNK